MHPSADALIAARFDTIIYDLDGTLIDSAMDMAAAISRVLADHGLAPVDVVEAGALMGEGSRITMRRAFAARGRDLDEAAITAVTRAFVGYYEADPVRHTRLFDGAADVIARFDRLGLRQGVCTNKFQNSARAILTGLLVMPPIAEVAGADTFDVRKPDPGHILKLVERLGSTRERAVMVGDSIHDIEAARRAGVPVVAVSWGYTARPARELGADAVIERFDALPDALAEIAGR